MKNILLFPSTTLLTVRHFFAVPIFFFFIGCDGFVESELPNSQLTSPTVFEDNATATAAMTNIYSTLRDDGLLSGKLLGAGSLLGHYTDELQFYGDGLSAVVEFYNNNLTTGNAAISALWNSSYRQIYACNSVIEGVASSQTLADADKAQLRGEALLTRGLIHFYLAGVYGDVPYVTTTDYRQNSIVSRLPVNQVYERIIADLEEASDLLPAAYASPERVRPNKFAAYALLARVNLYKGDWSQAYIMASAVLDQSAVYWVNPDLNAVFLKDSPSTIWQFMPASSEQNTEEALTYIFLTGPPPNTALRADFVAAFDSSDARRTNWIGMVTDGSSTWYHANKYKADGNENVSVEYPIVLRIEEMLLVRSEAAAALGLIDQAQADLNVIRNRAGLPNTTANTQQTLDTAVLNERRFEFFTEFGHRFFDLKRMGQLDTVLGSLKPAWSNTDRLWPLPQTELQANPNLRPQNSGY